MNTTSSASALRDIYNVYSVRIQIYRQTDRQIDTERSQYASLSTQRCGWAEGFEFRYAEIHDGSLLCIERERKKDIDLKVCGETIVSTQRCGRVEVFGVQALRDLGRYANDTPERRFRYYVLRD